MHLHKVRLDEKSRFTAAGTANDQHVFVSGIGRVLRSAGQHKSLGLCKDDVILRLRVHKGGNISFGAPWSVLSSDFFDLWMFFFYRAVELFTFFCYNLNANK